MLVRLLFTAVAHIFLPSHVKYFVNTQFPSYLGYLLVVLSNVLYCFFLKCFIVTFRFCYVDTPHYSYYFYYKNLCLLFSLASNISVHSFHSFSLHYYAYLRHFLSNLSVKFPILFFYVMNSSQNLLDITYEEILT